MQLCICCNPNSLWEGCHLLQVWFIVPSSEAAWRHPYMEKVIHPLLGSWSHWAVWNLMLLLSITLVQDFQVDVSGEVIYCELVSSGIIRCKIDGDGFRSQVVLKYGLRSILQSVFHGLIDASANESASDTEIDLLRSLFHLLQVLFWSHITFSIWHLYSFACNSETQR